MKIETTLVLLFIISAIANHLMDGIKFWGYFKSSKWAGAEGWRNRYVDRDPAKGVELFYKIVFFWPCDLWHWLKYIYVITMSFMLSYILGNLWLTIIFIMIYGGMNELGILIRKYIKK